MTDTPMPDWVLLEAAKRSGWFESLQLSYLQRCYTESNQMFTALCDMILKHEQPPVDRKLLCAREAVTVWERSDEDIGVEDACLHAIELYERGFGK
jgi:hypothetical protein